MKPNTSAVRGQDCRHTNASFDTLFHAVASRRDISPSAKLVHARLVSLHRLQRDETQTQIGEAVGLSRHQVWAAIRELMAAGLVVTIKYGLGLPNGYSLLGIDAADLAGRAGRQQGAGSGRHGGAHTYRKEERRAKNTVNRRPEPSEYLQSRHGPLRPR